MRGRLLFLVFAASLPRLCFAEAKVECSAEPVLRYFDVRGRGESIRVALSDIGVAFEDSSFTGEEWGKERSDGLKAKLTQDSKLAFGQVPLLEVDGLALVQSHSILRYLGRKYGWYIGTPEQLYAIDMVSDGTEDVRKRLSSIKYADISEEDKARLYKIFFTDKNEGQTWVGYLDKIVGASATGFASGSTDATHADYLLFDLLDYLDALGGAMSVSLLGGMPSLLKWRQMMLQRPNLKAYLEGPARRLS